MATIAGEFDVAAEVEARDSGLRRDIGTFGMAAAVVNITIGAGIFSLPAGMMRAAGPYAIVAYLACALAMAGVVLCFAEAGSRVPTSGGAYGYVEAAFGPLAGFVMGMLTWLSCVLANGGIAAALADALGGLVPVLASPAARIAIIVAALGILVAINLAGVRTASRLLSWVTVVKLLPLAMFVGIGMFYISPARMWAGDPPKVDGIGRAILLSLFAFQGMETTLGASGEVRDPARTLPRALIGAMAFVTIFYIAIQLVAQGLMGAALGASKAPLADAMAGIDPRLGLLILIGTVVSLGGWLGSDLLGAPRMLFAFARDGFLPASLGKVSPRTNVPAVAIIVHAMIGAALAITGRFEQLAVLSALAGCVLYVAGCASAWRLRRRGVALAGKALRLPALGFWCLVGIGSMAALIALAQWEEIGGLIAVLAAFALLYAITAGSRARRRPASGHGPLG
jgi:APA family basic amino acid/polyamine antiporter